jgi:thiol-disulfide isomerase/thioredoxin
VVFEPDPQPVPETEVPPLEIGAPAPAFNLPAVDGKYYSLRDFEAAPVLAVIFTCDHCPTAQAYEERIKAIVRDYEEKGVAVVAISPNSPLSLLHEECGYTDLHDDFEDMQIRARDHDFNFPYLYDGDTESASLKYGPVATPHAFVFDEKRRLRYRGRLDSFEKPGTGNAEDLRAALDALLAGEEVATPVTKTFGCSVKWAWKTEWKEKVEEDWRSRPVTVEEIDVEGIRRLIRNETSGKLRLINVWATWCGPCIIEYPEFLVMQRMYGARDFEFVSISADRLPEKGKVLEFLEEKESGVTNYIFAEEDKYALIDAIDSTWNGALPYTLLVAPGGERLYARQGTIKPLEVKRAIVEHPLMGRYY